MGDAPRRPADAAPATVPPKPQDVVVLGPPTADGDGVVVLRAQGERIEAGELRSIKEGQPIDGEIVSLAPRADNPRVLDVKESWKPPPPVLASGPKKGPAQVASQKYRDNYDEIFAAPPTKKSALN